MQAVIGACNGGSLYAEPSVVITNNSTSQALIRAKRAHIPNYIVNSQNNPYPDYTPDESILKILENHNTDLVVLAGYMKKLGTNILSAYPGRIINIHPSLLPKYGGKGMYGNNVHQAVLAGKETETGATVHVVGEEYDKGPILAQRSLAIENDDTVESLAQKVLVIEHTLLPETLAKIVSGEIKMF